MNPKLSNSHILRCIGISIAFLLIFACQSDSALNSAGTSALSTKEDYINEILSQLGKLYYSNPMVRGKQFEVLIRDFSLNDDETYAIVDALDNFWLINLPVGRKKTFGTEGISVWKSFSIDNVEKTAIDETRKKAIKRQFTVPGVLK